MILIINRSLNGALPSRKYSIMEHFLEGNIPLWSTSLKEKFHNGALPPREYSIMEHFLQGNSSINCTSLEIFRLLCGPLKAAGYYCLSSGSPYMLVEGLIGYSISKRSVTYNSGLIGWIFFLLPFFWSISPMKLALLEAMLYFLGDKRWPLATGQYCLKSVFTEIRVMAWFQVVSRQKNRPIIG